MKTSMSDRVRSAQHIVFDVSTELRALAYLFETQGAKTNYISETDMDKIGHGLAHILLRQVRRLQRAHDRLDRF